MNNQLLGEDPLMVKPALTSLTRMIKWGRNATTSSSCVTLIREFTCHQGQRRRLIEWGR